jgi:hypothetical protein
MSKKSYSESETVTTMTAFTLSVPLVRAKKQDPRVLKTLPDCFLKHIHSFGCTSCFTEQKAERASFVAAGEHVLLLQISEGARIRQFMTEWLSSIAHSGNSYHYVS